MGYIKKLTNEIVEKILSKGVRDMPQNPGAQGYSERQIRGFYYLPEQETLLLIMDIEENIAKCFEGIEDNKINVADIINSLTSDEEKKPLSAKQGKILKEMIERAIPEIDKLSRKVVEELPSIGEDNIIYLVPSDKSGEKNIKLEYMWIDGVWELIGSISDELNVDLTTYQPKTDETLNTESKEIVGAINELNTNKLDKPTTPTAGKGVVVINQNTGKVGTMLVEDSYVARPGWIAKYLRNTSVGDTKPVGEGTFVVQEPIKPYQVSNKKYVDDRFNGANKAVSFVNYSSMISSLNSLANTSYNIGQNVMIVTLNVPDLWISEIAEESVTYTYVSDDDFVNELNTNGSVQVGYFKLSALETQKVDLTDYKTKDTQINGTSIVENGVANIPIAGSSSANLGVVWATYTGNGLYILPSGEIRVYGASQAWIDQRGTASNAIHKPLCLDQMDYGVMSALTAPQTHTWTEEEQAAARETLGISGGGGTQLYKHVMVMERTTDEYGEEYWYELVCLSTRSEKFTYFHEAITYEFVNNLDSSLRMYRVKDGSRYDTYYNFLEAGVYNSFFPVCTMVDIDGNITNKVSVESFMGYAIEDYAPIAL